MKNLKKLFLVMSLFLGILFLYVPITASASSKYVEINKENFPDKVFRIYVSENSDLDGDNKLSTKEINAVTLIHVEQSTVKNLKGIEYFKNLRELNCSSSKITKLDLSKNTKLTYLDCSSNKITKLDLSKNTKLTNRKRQTIRLTVKLTPLFTSGVVSCIHSEDFLTKASNSPVQQDLYFLFHHRALVVL